MSKSKNEYMHRNSPTFVAKFSDGVVTRMTTYCLPEAPDLRRGIALARAAYSAHTKQPAPAIVEAHFEMPNCGAVLQQYDRTTLETAS